MPLRPFQSVGKYWQNDGGKIISSSKVVFALHEPRPGNADFPVGEAAGRKTAVTGTA